MPTKPFSNLSRLRSVVAGLLGVPLALVLAGCGTNRVTSTTLATLPPAQVLTTQPPARSVGVPYDTPVSVDFAADMDVSTLNTRNVFFKLDTQRLAASLTWEAGARRLHIVPQSRLLLRRTYTVEFSSAVKAADGSTFGPSGWFFQFTTNGARRPLHARPVPSALDESPFAAMLWDSTESTAGTITYELWVGIDSASVAVRSGLPLATLTKPYWLPLSTWPLGQKIYWAVTVLNASVPERFDGPVQSFTTITPGTPTDSILVRGDDAGFNQIITAQSRVNPFQNCSLDTIGSSPGTQAWMRFTPILLPPDTKLASARLEIYTNGVYAPRIPTTEISVWSSLIPWPAPCQPGLQFPERLPIRDQLLAVGRLESGFRLIYMSDLLTAHVEASIRLGGFFGYELFSNRRVAYTTARVSDPSVYPYLKIHYYRTPAP